MEQFVNLESLETWQLWLLAGIGLGLALVGYRIKKIAFFVIWFIVGYVLMGYLMPIINASTPAIAENQILQWVLPLGGGLLVALLGFTIEKLCLGGACFALVLMATAQYFGTDPQTLVIGAVVGVVAAGAAVILMKPATIIATAVAGGYALAVAILMLFPQVDAEVCYWPILAGTAAVGSAVQFLTTRRD
ncbi:DUF4203 domain-containing protein [Candidatus Saccharibacteria bacterium]|nr:DUF4203 domain-containing protein [Candidatus Saccharibacteria bacterium]